MPNLKRNIIFYVDDDRDDLDLFETVIEDMGDEVLLFELGSNLLKAMHNPPPQASIVFFRP
jgi:DNA-binding NtrC family response regulator